MTKDTIKTKGRNWNINISLSNLFIVDNVMVELKEKDKYKASSHMINNNDDWNIFQ